MNPGIAYFIGCMVCTLAECTLLGSSVRASTAISVVVTHVVLVLANVRYCWRALRQRDAGQSAAR